MTQFKSRGPDGGATGAAVVGVSAALLAVAGALCCVGPVVVAVLGVGGAVAAASLAPYQPWFVGLAGVSLGYGFWRAYRRKKTCEGEACSAQRNRAIISFAATLAVVTLAVPYALSVWG